MTAVPPPSPPAAPETDVSAMTADDVDWAFAQGLADALVEAMCKADHEWDESRAKEVRAHMRAALAAIGVSGAERADLEAARGRVRVVEGERDKWRSRALSNAEQCDRNWAEACRATARAESAEAALAELRETLEVIVTTLESGASVKYATLVDARALLGGAS